MQLVGSHKEGGRGNSGYHWYAKSDVKAKIQPGVEASVHIDLYDYYNGAEYLSHSIIDLANFQGKGEIQGTFR